MGNWYSFREKKRIETNIGCERKEKDTKRARRARRRVSGSNEDKVEFDEKIGEETTTDLEWNG